MKQPLNILFISPTVDSYIGGTETVVSQLAQHLKHKVRLSILSGRVNEGRGGLLHLDGFSLATVPFLGRDTRLNRLLSKLLLTSRFKIESKSFFMSLRRSEIDLTRYDRIVTFYEADAYLLHKYYPHLCERFCHMLPGVSLRRFFSRVPPNDVFFLGYRAASRAKRKWGVDIQSLPLGVDNIFFPESPPAFPSHRRLMFVGRLDKSKNVDWLVRFFIASELFQRGYELHIVGDGPLYDELAAMRGKSEGIVLHGRKRPDEVAGLLRQAFLLLHPTDLESFGLTVLEAMAAGVPVITHELDSIKIWAKDCPCYALHLDNASWAAQIARFQHQDYWEAVSARNLEYAKEFSWDEIADQILHILSNR